MWARRIAAATVLTAVAATGAVHLMPPLALAGGPGDPIVGDLNGDRIPDVAVLAAQPAPGARQGARVPYRCEVVVTFGSPGGGTPPPERHPYLTVPTPADCPDLGEALNLDGDPEDELVASWFIGTPPIVDRDLIVLDDFQVRNVADGIQQPSLIGKSDFNGDGREDLYEWTDEGDGFITLINDGNGGLIAGPIRLCSGNRPDFRFSEFNRRPGTDVVIAYVQGCGPYFSGVEVMFADGQVVHLQQSVLGDETWSLQVRDVNGDNWPDVGTVAESTGRITWFVALPGGRFVRVPVAVQDKPVVSGTRRTAIRVMENDYATGAARISIVTPPRYGRVQVTSSRTIVYTPDPRHGRTDRFVYRLTEDGRSSNASVNLRIR